MGDCEPSRTSTWVIELQSLGEPQDYPPSIESARWSDSQPGASPASRVTTGPDRLVSSESTHHQQQQQQPLPGALPCLTFTKGRDGQYHLQKQTKLRNSLLWMVGFLETANAGDFAANVWNMSPVPTYAMVFMAIGGTVALGCIYFCIKDARLSYQNLQGLRRERRCLRAERDHYRGTDDVETLQTIDCFLDVNFREMGTEIVDRISMDSLLGLSALMVAVGTFLAMDGDREPALYRASNLLTGYIGNTPPAMYGLSNLLWSGYVWNRARLQRNAAAQQVRGTRVERMLKMRTSTVQMHAGLNGATGVVAGAAAVATATMWWGYVVLAPCVVTSGLVNMLWRSRVGYERPFMFVRPREVGSIDVHTVVEALRYADSCRQMVWNSGTDAFTTLVHDQGTPADALEFIHKNCLFEDFCVRLLREGDVAPRILESLSGTGTIDWQLLATTDDAVLVARMCGISRALINEAAPKCFGYQERYLLEVLGCFMYRGIAEKGKAKGGKGAYWPGHHGVRAGQYPPRATYADVGRHANDWLFGGFSVTKAARKIWGR